MESTEPTSLTVGSCAFNEKRNIAKLVRNVLELTGLLPDARIVVVASGYTDNTLAIVREIMKGDASIKLVEETARLAESGRRQSNTEVQNRSSGVLSSISSEERGVQPRLKSFVKEGLPSHGRRSQERPTIQPT